MQKEERLKCFKNVQRIEGSAVEEETKEINGFINAAFSKDRCEKH